MQNYEDDALVFLRDAKAMIEAMEKVATTVDAQQSLISLNIKAAQVCAILDLSATLGMISDAWIEHIPGKNQHVG